MSHDDKLGDVADRQREAQVQVLPDRQLDAASHQRLKALELRGELVAADAQLGKRYRPSASVTTVRAAPVSIFRAVTVAPGT